MPKSSQLKVDAAPRLIDVLTDSLRRDVGDRPVAISLSGGVDSAITAALCVRLGFRTRAWCFRMADRRPSDWVRAHELADAVGVPIEDVPMQPPTMRDVRWLASVGCRRKTAFECLWPRANLLRAVEESVVVTGDGADGWFGTSKKAILHHREPLERFTVYQLSLIDDPDYAQRRLVRWFAGELGKAVAMPLSEGRLKRLWIGRTWWELNKPRNKEPLRALADELGVRPISHHQNLQLGDSGIAEAFRNLANREGFLTSVGLFNAVVREHEKSPVEAGLESDAD
jgi:asparagine synthetase B (glutamine-hydrolysing)